MKKILIIFCLVVLVLFLLPTAAFFTVQHPKVQKMLVDETAKQLSNKLGAKVSVGSVRFRLFNRLVLNDVYIQDMKGDTLIFVSRLAGSLTRLHFSDRYVEVGTLRLTDARLNLEKDTAGVLNLSSLINGLKSSSDTSLPKASKEEKPFHLRVHNVEVERLLFSYTDYFLQEPTSDSAINFRHVIAEDVSFKVSALNMDGDTMVCRLDHLQLKERSGFNLHKLSGVVSVAPTFIEVKQLVVRDDFSDINAKYYRMDYDKFADFTDYIEKVRMSADFVSSKVDLYTIAFFAPKMSKLHLNVGLTGLAGGPVSNLRGRDLTLEFGEGTKARVNFSMQGLPDVHNTFFTFDVKNFTSSPEDLLLADNIVLNGKYVKQQALLQQLGALQGKARFTGFLSNFVADGVLLSDIGTLISDLSFAPTPDSTMLINGTLGTDNFNLGKLINDTVMGKINFYGKVSGTFKNIKNLSLNADLSIPMVELYGYPYRHTKLKGLITENSFRGELLCEDANMNFDFRGVANFEKEKSQFDFKLQLHHADFVAVGLNKRDSLSLLNMEAVASFEGNSIDNFAGEFSINSARYTTTLGEFPVDSVHLEAKHSGNTEHLSLKSDILEATLKAKGGMSNVVPALDSILRRFVPAYHNLLPVSAAHGSAPKKEKEAKPQEVLEYSFSLLTKNAEMLQQMLIPTLMVADSTSLSGCISSDISCAKLTLSAPAIRYANLHLSDVRLRSASQASQLHFSVKAKKANLNDLKLQDWEVAGTLENSLLALTSSHKTNIASGKVKAQALFFENRHGKKGIDVELFPSTLVLSDVIWNLSQSKIRVEDKRYTIDSFRLESDLQLLHVNGVASQDIRDTLSCTLRNLSVGPLLHTLNSKVELEGNVSGEVSVKGVLAPSPLLFANVQASAVTLFKKQVGSITLHTFTSENEKDLAIQLHVNKDSEENLSVAGTLQTDGKVQALAKLNKVGLYHISPLLAGTLSDIDGTLSGDLDVTGTLKHLLLNGNLLMNQGQLKVDYLNSTFRMSGPVAVKNSTLQMLGIPVKDDKNSVGKLNFTLANITTPDDLHFSLTVKPDKFHVVNTTEHHNDYFYGQGYATGTVQISGKRGETSINATATTDDKTSLSIPLGSKTQVQGSNFINFVTPADDAEVQKKEENHAASNIKVDLNLDVTSDADLMLVLNQNTGDVIKAAGNGNLKIEVEPAKSLFRIFGTYTMQRGEYAISIQNLVNKKFKIDNGSSITFNGEVDAATADIHATYKVRAPLSDLFGDTATVRYKRAMPIDCKVSMTGRLTAPDLKFEIDAPTADNETRDRMLAQLNTEDNVVIQFLSLLLIDRFVPQQDMSGYGQSIGGNTIGGFVASQLTNLLSSFAFAGLNFGATLNIADSYSESDWGFSLNANITDRIIISASVEHQAQRKQLSPNSSEYLGDVDLEVMLDKSGKLRLKMFGHANDQYTEMMAGSNRYGVGLFYQEDFDSFADLWRAIFSKKAKSKNAAPATSQNSS
ncbi:MAG: translocation/assembly module TamB domain-containing protein [Prevotellaceae bacterium]|nr:translocation/assembly module TamB domain-containing protein [Prevotellaceae bacterium]